MTTEDFVKHSEDRDDTESECCHRLALIRDAWADVERHLQEHPIGGGLAARLDILSTRIVGP